MYEQKLEVFKDRTKIMGTLYYYFHTVGSATVYTTA